MELPIEKMRALIIETILTNQVTIVIGTTGSGKTTMLPMFLHRAGLAWSKRIGITEPRRLAAASVAQYLGRRLNTAEEQVVGYKVRFDDTTDLNTDIKFMTDGTLLQEFQRDPLLSDYSVIMIDEAHERSANIDFLLGLLKLLLRKRADLKLIVASATIDAQKFSAYFDRAPVVNVGGRQHEVTIAYSDHDCTSPQEMIDESVARVLAIHHGEEKGDILVFFPGTDTIYPFIQKLEEQKVEGLIALPAHGQLTSEELQGIFQMYEGKRKVIAATNIAETSITISNIVFVVDCGFIKQSEFYPATGVGSLDVIEHSQAGCDQRTGRAGRTKPGICYRLYTEENYRKRVAHTETELRRISLAGIVLKMESLGIPDVRNFEFIDMPKRSAIDEAYETLEALGAVVRGVPGLTTLGEEMATLPLEPYLARMVLEARRFDCVEDIVIIVSFLAHGRPMYARPNGKELEASVAQAKFTHPKSDMLTILKTWKAYEAMEGDETWCEKNFIEVRSMRETANIRGQLLQRLFRLGVKAGSTSNPMVILRCVASGLVHNLLAHVSRHAYSGVVRKVNKVFIHPKSALFSAVMTHRWIVAAEIASTTKLFAFRCSAVLPEWLPELAPEKFSLGKRVLKGPSPKEGEWRARQWIEHVDKKGHVVKAGETGLIAITTEAAANIQVACVDEAKANCWILLEIAEDVSGGVVGRSKDGTVYPLVETLLVSAEEATEWYCSLDDMAMPGHVFARPQFPFFAVLGEAVTV